MLHSGWLALNSSDKSKIIQGETLSATCKIFHAWCRCEMQGWEEGADWSSKMCWLGASCRQKQLCKSRASWFMAKNTPEQKPRGLAMTAQHDLSFSPPACMQGTASLSLQQGQSTPKGASVSKQSHWLEVLQAERHRSSLKSSSTLKEPLISVLITEGKWSMAALTYVSSQGRPPAEFIVRHSGLLMNLSSTT